VCEDCAGHQGRGDLLAKSMDHETLYWERMQRAVAGETDAHQRANAALVSRDRAVRMLAIIRQDHRIALAGCSCGKTDCETGSLVSSKWVDERIRALGLPD
jgi:hypothetical protein